MESSNKSDNLVYMCGLGNSFESEAIKGALPRARNNPQKCEFGLYAEQLSGTSFTTERHNNLRTWLYRILPTVGHSNHTDITENEFPFFISDFSKDENMSVSPDQLRWKPFPFPKESEKVDFLHGIFTFCGVGSPDLKVNLIKICNFTISSI